jgi:Ser/Thr protein kinase RdoA (MazF antagonist)
VNNSDLDFDARPAAERLAVLRELARAALPAWGLPADLEPQLVTERENAVFRVEADGRGAFALRVHRSGYHSDAQLRSQVVWARALEADGVVHTAAVLDTNSGEPFTVVSHPGVPTPRQVTLLEWEPGVPLSELGGGDTAMLHTLGSMMARLHQHAVSWIPPDGFDTLRWDSDGLVGDDPEWGRFWEADGLDPSDAEMMRDFRVVAGERLTEFGTSPERFGLVHGDFLPENVLVARAADPGEHPDGPDGADIAGERITLLDFDDCGQGWFLFDIATALAMPSLRPDFTDLRDAFVDGYRTQRPLGDGELEWLDLFLALRGATYAGWVHSRSQTDFARALGPMIVAAAAVTVREFLGA